MKHFLLFFSNDRVHLSALNAGIWLSAVDWTVKLIFGLPSAIYLCLKIYHEFINPDKIKNSYENDAD